MNVTLHDYCPTERGANAPGGRSVVSGLLRTPAERLFDDNRHLIFFVLHRRFSTLLTGDERQEDVVAVAELWLWKAAMRHDPTRAKFSSFAVRYIEGGILHHLASLRRQKRIATVSLSSVNSAGGDLNDLMSAGDILSGHAPAGEAPGVNLLANAGLERLLEGVLPLPAQVIRLVYQDGMTQTQAAHLLGVTRQRVSQLHKQGLQAVVRIHGSDILTECSA